MKIAIVGTGAMGSIYAALFANAGHEVFAVDTWQAHVDAINTKGLRVEGASGDRTVPIQATTDPAEVGPVDLVVLATKASGVAPAAAQMGPLLGADTLVLTIQNGLGAAERIQAALPGANILLGVAQGFGASMKGPGHAHHNGMAKIRLGELTGGITERLTKIETLWRKAGFTVEAYDDIHQLIWEKFICNVSFSAPCTVFQRTVGEMKADPGTWALCLGCGREAFAVARAKGIKLSFDDPEAYVTEFANGILGSRPSMLLDHLAQQRSEIDAINGMVPELGEELGIATPFNTAACAIVRAREALF